MAWFVYVLRCGDGTLYTGITNDVDARVATHNAGRGARYTRARLPVAVVHVERKRSRSSALKREYAIKGLDREAKLDLFRACEAGVATPPARPASAPRPSTDVSSTAAPRPRRRPAPP